MIASKRPRALKDWLEGQRGRPVFAFLHLFDVHAPYQPPAEFAAALASGQADNMEVTRSLYRAEIAYLDDCLGELLDLPGVRAGIVAVTADHGELLGGHGIFFGHAELYPDTLHVPLLLRWPGSPEGLAVGGAVRQQDVGRSFLDLAGLGAGARPGQAPKPSTFVIASGAASASIRAGGWMLVLHLAEHSQGMFRRARKYERHELELFHLEQDPGAAVDLVQSEPARARMLREQLVAWLHAAQPAGVSVRAMLDVPSISTLQQLGYGGGDLGGSESRGSFCPASCDCEFCSR